ncbi:Cation/H+ exchanger [Paraphysoderma sedebokerense]|nr:Cation/H+ exchanger [Paraphysoderma sedebokerense]
MVQFVDFVVDDVTLICLILGSFILFYGLISLGIKEKLYLSESLVATIFGIIIGPYGADLFTFFRSNSNDHHEFDKVMFQFARIAVGIQVMFAGVELPAKYIKKQWKSLAMLLGPCMTLSWLATAGLIHGILGVSWLNSLIIGSCVAPTDPVLANSIVRGKFAEKYVPVHVRDILSAESGANDGLGFPFLFIGLLIKLEPLERENYGHALSEWVIWIVLYQVVLGCAMGAVIGWGAKTMMWYSKKLNLMDKESFLSFAIALAIFTIGVVGRIESDDLLACFVAGNFLNWDDQFRQSIESEHIQSVFDNLINLSFFVFFGATYPWETMGTMVALTPWRLVLLGITVMLFRRLPFVFILHNVTPAIRNWKEAMFAGWFGPIGVSGLFYAYLLTHYQKDVPDIVKLTIPVVSFLVLTSVIVHGVTVPIFKLSKNIHRRRISWEKDPASSNESEMEGMEDNDVDKQRDEEVKLEIVAKDNRREEVAVDIADIHIEADGRLGR